MFRTPISVKDFEETKRALSLYPSTDFSSSQLSLFAGPKDRSILWIDLYSPSRSTYYKYLPWTSFSRLSFLPSPIVLATLLSFTLAICDTSVFHLLRYAQASQRRCIIIHPVTGRS
ncbi:hypothetical protein LENED_005216 [Lentinula edodes]|uniref:Uncharacterized protein n=1 Tax=Lentinula edodes TaxID=5353 RepID=A0A1Q3E8B5_LENED|nr:hypothetical protein LENED_005216 [Lentinula edodes]